MRQDKLFEGVGIVKSEGKGMKMKLKTTNTLQDAINFIKAFFKAYHETIFEEMKNAPPEAWMWLLRHPRSNFYKDSDFKIEYYYDKNRELVCFHLLPVKELFEPTQILNLYDTLKKKPPRLLEINERKTPPFEGMRSLMDSAAEWFPIKTPKGEMKGQVSMATDPVISSITINLNSEDHFSKKRGEKLGKGRGARCVKTEKNWWAAKETLKTLERDFPQAKDRLADLTAQIEELLGFKRETEQLLGDSSSKFWVVHGFQGKLNEFRVRLDGFEKRLDDFKTRESLSWKRLSFYIVLASLIVTSFIGLIGVILKVLEVI